MKLRANASALLCFVLLATLTVLVVIDFPGVASVQPMFRGGNGETAALATTSSSSSSSNQRDREESTTMASPSSSSTTNTSSSSSSSSSSRRSSSSSVNVLNSDDLVSATTDAPTDQDNWCRFCFEDISGMGEDYIVRCTHQARHPTCMRCYVESHLIYKFDPRKCYGCNVPDAITIDVAALTPEQKAVYARCQAELVEEAEKKRREERAEESESEERRREYEERVRREEEERRRALEDSLNPFMRALYSGVADEAEPLIERGEVGDINAVDSHGQSTLMYAIQYSISEVFQQLLAYSIQTNQPIHVNYVNQRRSTLMFAIRYAGSKVGVVQQLLDYSIKTNQPIDVTYVNEEWGLSTLMWAIDNERSEVLVQQLLDYSIKTSQPIDVNYENQQEGEQMGRSTLMYAFRYTEGEAVQQLLDYSIQTNQPIDVTYVNEERGESTLMYAIQHAWSKFDVVQQLLDYSIQTNQPINLNYVNQREGEQMGRSTLMYAMDYAGREVVQQLLDYSIQTNQPIDVTYVEPRWGESTLMWAIGSRSKSVQQLFDYSIQTGQPIDVNYVNQRTGESTFDYALRRFTFNPEDALNVVRLLIHYSSFDVNASLNEKGETALMLAMSVEYGRADVVRELLQVPGIDLNQKNNLRDGKTAEQYALESSNNEIRKLLGIRELAGKTWFTRLQETLGGWDYGPSGI